MTNVRWVCAAAVLATVGVAGLALPARAESPPVAVRLFDLGSVVVRPDGLARLVEAIRQVERPGECPLGKLTVTAPAGDPLFQQALVYARRDATLAALEGQGLHVAGRLVVETVVGGGADPAVDVRYDPAEDVQPPTLRTSSTPLSGRRVRPGQGIVVRMAARDDADRWQTGVKTVQLVADSDGGAFVASESYAPCSDPREKRVEATYVVPADPPPLVRLTALTDDHAGRTDTDTATFPTGDWSGTLEFRFRSRTEPTTTSSGEWSDVVAMADVGLRQKPDGAVEGSLLGTIRSETWWGYAGHDQYCHWKSLTPGVVRARLHGALDPARGYPLFQAEDMSAQSTNDLIDARQCESPPTPFDASLTMASMLPMLVHRLERSGDGAFAASLTVAVGSGEIRYTLTLRRVPS